MEEERGNRVEVHEEVKAGEREKDEEELRKADCDEGDGRTGWRAGQQLGEESRIWFGRNIGST